MADGGSNFSQSQRAEVKDVIRDFFYNLLTATRIVSSTYAQVARAQSCANHVQDIKRLSHAACRDKCHVVRRDSSATECKSHLFELYFTGWTIKPMKEGRKSEHPKKTHLVFKQYNTKS